MATVGVLGTTTWGTTLGLLAARNGHRVRLHARTDAEAAQLNTDREHRLRLPGNSFPQNLSATSSAEEAFGAADLLFVVVPSTTLRENVRQVASAIPSSTIIVSGTKGLEIESGMRMSEVLAAELPSLRQGGVCALSGPNLATEIVQGKPSTTVVASTDITAAQEVQALISSDLFRVYTNADVTGVEFGGALKNIIALGAGVIDGMEYGDNAKAAFITRGLAEIARLGVAAGADPATFAGLAGMGDLIATCASKLSRNHYVGVQLAAGRSVSEVLASMTNVAEGVSTTAAAVRLSASLGVEMPIAQATNDVLFHGVPIESAVASLLGRALTLE